MREGAAHHLLPLDKMKAGAALKTVSLPAGSSPKCGSGWLLLRTRACPSSARGVVEAATWPLVAVAAPAPDRCEKALHDSMLVVLRAEGRPISVGSRTKLVLEPTRQVGGAGRALTTLLCFVQRDNLPITICKHWSMPT